MSGDSNEPKSAYVKCPSCGEDLHDVDLGARSALRNADEQLEAVRDQRDALAVELADLRRRGREQVDRLQERVNELKRLEIYPRNAGETTWEHVAFRLLKQAFKWAEANEHPLDEAPTWYREARRLFPDIVKDDE
jgi:DNA repair exonuclease SbcCD ATPase subunit